MNTVADNLTAGKAPLFRRRRHTRPTGCRGWADAGVYGYKTMSSSARRSRSHARTDYSSWSSSPAETRDVGPVDEQMKYESRGDDEQGARAADQHETPPGVSLAKHAEI